VGLHWFSFTAPSSFAGSALRVIGYGFPASEAHAALPLFFFNCLINKREDKID